MKALIYMGLDIEKLQNRVDQIEKDTKVWYQAIEFVKGVRTHRANGESDEIFYSRPDFGINKWNNFVKPFLPFSLEKKIVLEIGSNAGLYLIKAIKEGADFAYGIEPTKEMGGFYEQSLEVISLFSEIESFDYVGRIKILPINALDDEWEYKINDNIDITFALNALYWVTCDGEDKEIPNASEKMQKLIDRIFRVSEYLLILGDEGIEDIRTKKNLNNLCTGLSTTLPFLKGRKIQITKNDFTKTDRKPSLILAKTDEFVISQIEIDLIYKYFDYEKKNASFFNSYEKFCISINNGLLNTEKEFMETEYANYLTKKCKTIYEVKSLLYMWKDLFLDIKNNGLQEPINLFLSENVEVGRPKNNLYRNNMVEFEGAHRLICKKVLGKKYIKVKCKKNILDIIINILKKHRDLVKKGEI